MKQDDEEEEMEQDYEEDNEGEDLEELMQEENGEHEDLSNKKSKDCMQNCFLIFVYFKCCSDFLLYFYKCSTSMAFT